MNKMLSQREKIDNRFDKINLTSSVIFESYL